VSKKLTIVVLSTRLVKGELFAATTATYPYTTVKKKYAAHKDPQPVIDQDESLVEYYDD
jgi:hypothetical protein